MNNPEQVQEQQQETGIRTISVMEQPPAEAEKLPGAPGPVRVQATDLSNMANDPDKKVSVVRMPESVRQLYPGLTDGATKAEFEQIFRDSFRSATLDADIEVSGRHAHAIWALAQLIQKYQVTYKDAATLIFGAEPEYEQQNPATHKTVISQNYKGDDPKRVDERSKAGSRYRQAAQRHYFLARATAGDVKDKEPAWPASVIIGGMEFVTPVEALLAGNTLTRVHDMWKEAWKMPVEDLTKASDHIKGAFKAGKDQAEKLFVTARKYNDAKGGDTRARIKVIENGEAIKGFMEKALPRFTWNEKEAIRVLRLMGYEAATIEKATNKADDNN